MRLKQLPEASEQCIVSFTISYEQALARVRIEGHSLQGKASGGLPSNNARELRRRVIGLEATSVSPDRPPPLRSGTRLSRERHGRTHHVHVVDGGIVSEALFQQVQEQLASNIGDRRNGRHFVSQAFLLA